LLHLTTRVFQKSQLRYKVLDVNQNRATLMPVRQGWPMVLCSIGHVEAELALALQLKTLRVF
jgi:hypothetical protein